MAYEPVDSLAPDESSRFGFVAWVVRMENQVASVSLQPSDACRRTLWGILGGVGPIASAEFLKTIYDRGTKSIVEQSLPKLILMSDPSFSDRTSSILDGNHELLRETLKSMVARLLEWGATDVVICCFTLHYLIPQLPDGMRSRILSLISLTVDSVLRLGGRQLVLCSTGSRAVEIFQTEPRWPLVRDQLVFPSERDQDIVHSLIYDLKLGRLSRDQAEVVTSLCAKYEVRSYIVACTELHILSKRFGERIPYLAIDAMAIAADRMNSAYTSVHYDRGEVVHDATSICSHPFRELI
jgi:aspartate racemase